MAEKPTYEELKQRIKESDNQVTMRRRAEQALREKEAELEIKTRSL